MSRELDALVAEKVHDLELFTATEEQPGSYIGCRVSSGTYLRVRGESGSFGPVCEKIPAYSSDIAAAWAVVERMRKQFTNHFTLLAFTTNWRAGLGTPFSSEEVRTWGGKPADTAPLAICLAALRAVGVPEDEIQKAVAA